MGEDIAMDKMNFQAWEGRETTARSAITEDQAAHIHATLGSGPAPRHGDALPQLWHWCAFLPTALNDALGRDGHVARSKLLPSLHLPRRMWAGGQLTFHMPLHIGDPIERQTRVRSIVEKEGQAGPLVLVTLDHTLHGPNGLAISERQDIVYLEIPEVFSPPAKKALPTEPIAQIETPETLLFRYSAITFNAHRIHYDLPYTQEAEKYPGLVVHGPMQATFLMRTATEHAGRPPSTFAFRGVHPMFSGTPCDIALQDNTDCGLQLWTGQNGHQCMQATAKWEDAA